MKKTVPKIPQLIQRKIYKTGQTRGADDDVIYQNRVARNSTVLIPYESWSKNFTFPKNETKFENGFIVLIPPKIYFSDKLIDKKLKAKGLKIGVNCLVFYYSRDEWNLYDPEKLKWKPAQNRKSPLGGKYVARVPATTASENGGQIRKGFTTTSGKGAGIRVFEYASTMTIEECRFQLEALFWLCFDSETVMINNGMKKKDAILRKDFILKHCLQSKLLDYKKLVKVRLINKNRKTTCPLCLEEISANGFFSRMKQAEGRNVADITVTEINLFHVDELRVREYNHRPYNLGWGHHHCNVVVKDSGIQKTLEWMKGVLQKNIENGFI